MPRRTWLDSKIDVFLEELAVSGMHLDRQRAGELITGQVRAVATLMRVTEATARTYLGDEIIKDMARRMLFEVADEWPGAGVAGAATLALDQCDLHRPTPNRASPQPAKSCSLWLGERSGLRPVPDGDSVCPVIDRFLAVGGLLGP